MPFRILILRLMFAVAGAILASEGFAHPIDCTPGYSDSHCVTPIRTNAIPAPTCPNAPGYSTITPPTWAGYKWSQPTCSSYQAPPTCSAGYIQTTNPVWDGSNWSLPGCTLQAAPPPVRDPLASCPTSLQGYTGSYSWLSNGDATQMGLVYARANGITGYSSVFRSTYIYGATYDTSCATSNQYQALCYVNPDNALNTVLYVPTGNKTGGGGNCQH